jgi:hypothetical protein
MDLRPSVPNKSLDCPSLTFELPHYPTPNCVTTLDKEGGNRRANIGDEVSKRVILYNAEADMHTTDPPQEEVSKFGN